MVFNRASFDMRLIAQSSLLALPKSMLKAGPEGTRILRARGTSWRTGNVSSSRTGSVGNVCAQAHEHPHFFGHHGCARAAQIEQMDKTSRAESALTGPVAQVLVFPTLVTYVVFTLQFQPHCSLSACGLESIVERASIGRAAGPHIDTHPLCLPLATASSSNIMQTPSLRNWDFSGE